MFIIYRLPSTQQNGLSARFKKGFLNELAEFISKDIITTSEIIITGDNILRIAQTLTHIILQRFQKVAV